MPYKDPEKRNQHQREYRKKNPEKVKLWKKKCMLNNPEKYKNTAKNYAIKNRDKARKRKRDKILEKYNLTENEYNELLKIQENKCGICTKELKNPCIDHNHSTGEVRGLLCVSCNYGLGLLGDNLESVLKTLYYLNKHLYEA